MVLLRYCMYPYVYGLHVWRCKEFGDNINWVQIYETLHKSLCLPVSSNRILVFPYIFAFPIILFSTILIFIFSKAISSF